MLHFPGSIPITIHPFFWVLAILIGWINSFSISGTVVWAVVITFSVLVHEFGHAIPGKIFGQKVSINLLGFGGLTYRQGSKLKHWQEFVVVVCGPLAGILLGLCGYGALLLIPDPMSFWAMLFRITFYINIFWSLFNLIPVLPLDGGHLLRIILESIFGFKGARFAHLLGLVLGVAIGAIFLINGLFLVGGMFLILAYESFRAWKDSGSLAQTDQDEDLKKEFAAARILYEKNLFDRAFPAFEALLKKTQSGLLHVMSRVYLAKMTADRQDLVRAYEFLEPVKELAPPDSVELLHHLAFSNGDFVTVRKNANECYRLFPTAVTALLNAQVFASIADCRSAIGWLESAQREGMALSKSSLDTPHFDPLRENPKFQHYIESLEK